MEQQYIFIGRELGIFFDPVLNVSEELSVKDVESSLEKLRSCAGIFIMVNSSKVCEQYVDLTVASGVRIAQNIRLSEIDVPIIFVANRSRDQLIHDSVSNSIINAVGHSFQQFDQASAARLMEEMEMMEPLSPLELYDVQNSVCSKEGLVHEIGHMPASNVQDIQYELFTETLAKMAEVYQANPNPLISAFKADFPVVNQDNFQPACNKVMALGEELIGEYGINEPKESNLSVSVKRNWSLLWVDDEANIDHPLIALLEQNNVDVILCNTAEDAIEALHQDWKCASKIAVLLADYRLYEQPEGKIQQKTQGYKLLSYVVKSIHMVRLAALSALPRKFLLHSFKYYNIRTEVFSKKDHLNSDQTRKLLCENLLSMGDENCEAILSMPSGTSGWKHLKDSYIEHRNAPDYLAIEQKISEKANFYIREFLANGSFPEAIPFKSEFKKGALADKTIEKFQHYLLGRRLALWLGAVRNCTHVRIAELLCKRHRSDYKQVISQYLGLRIDDFPFNMTIEEKKWFHYDQGISIYFDLDLSTNILTQLEAIFGDYISNHKELGLQIKSNVQAASLGLKIEKDGKPRFRFPTQVKALYSFIAFQSTSINEIGLFTQKLNSLFVKNLIRQNLRYSIFDLSKYFRRKYLSFKPDNNKISNHQNQLIHDFVEIIKLSKPKQQVYWVDFKDDDLEFIGTLFIAKNNIEQKTGNLFPDYDELRQETLLLLEQDKNYSTESRKLTANNVTFQGKDRMSEFEDESYDWD